jgi:hypothetical protein
MRASYNISSANDGEKQQRRRRTADERTTKKIERTNNSHNGHMIKFQFFEKSSSLNCHFKNLGTYVVSIAHYMRAYFNYQALTHGNDFSLPGDVGFLNVS